jgi:hypothetical protein
MDVSYLFACSICLIVFFSFSLLSASKCFYPKLGNCFNNNF